MPAMFSANLPTLVPPNLSTTQPPGRCFSSVCAIRSDSCVVPFVYADMLGEGACACGDAIENVWFSAGWCRVGRGARRGIYMQ